MGTGKDVCHLIIALVQEGVDGDVKVCKGGAGRERDETETDWLGGGSFGVVTKGGCEAERDGSELVEDVFATGGAGEGEGEGERGGCGRGWEQGRG